jgi:hypothetical protein
VGAGQDATNVTGAGRVNVGLPVNAYGSLFEGRRGAPGRSTSCSSRSSPRSSRSAQATSLDAHSANIPQAETRTCLATRRLTIDMINLAREIESGNASEALGPLGGEPRQCTFVC